MNHKLACLKYIFKVLLVSAHSDSKLSGHKQTSLKTSQPTMDTLSVAKDTFWFQFTFDFYSTMVAIALITACNMCTLMNTHVLKFCQIVNMQKHNVMAMDVTERKLEN